MKEQLKQVEQKKKKKNQRVFLWMVCVFFNSLCSKAITVTLGLKLGTTYFSSFINFP